MGCRYPRWGARASLTFASRRRKRLISGIRPNGTEVAVPRAEPMAAPIMTGVRGRQSRRGPVVHATDLSAAAAAAGRAASALARTSGRRLLLVHVLTPLPLFGRGRMKTRDLVALALAQRRFAEAALTARASALRARGLRVAWLLRSGVAHREIVAAAATVRASVLVVGIGPRRLSRAFFGSTAERVIAAAPCPVLTVPALGRPGAARASRRQRIHGRGHR